MFHIDNRYFPALGRIFSPIVLESLIKTGRSAYLDEVIKSSGFINSLNLSMSLRNFFDFLYAFLLKKYRNEYIYKNVIANKILLGKHSLNTSHMLTEFRASNCKADVVILNGSSTVYEIKSEYDSFDRLENQIQSYLKIFDHINVITSHSQLHKLENILPKKIGIMVLTDRQTINTVRESESNKGNVYTNTIFNSLRKKEYITIIRQLYGHVPDVPNTQIFQECNNIFKTLSPVDVHDAMVKILRERRNSKIMDHMIMETPQSLKAYSLTLKPNKIKINNFLDILKKKISTILSLAI